MEFSLINLGCNKNLVDSQHIIGKLIVNYNNLKFNSNPYSKNVHFVILNTCGFIDSARKEMFHTLQELIVANKKIILFGCGLHFYTKIKKNDFPSILDHPNVFKYSREDIGKFDLNKLKTNYQSDYFSDFERIDTPRAYTNSIFKFEYIKIAEGCNNSCSFCIIPQIRGKQKSKSIEIILDEVNDMLDNGIQEIILLSQDSTRYGVDLYGKPCLLDLLEKINNISSNVDFKFRVLYLYPDIITFSFLEKLKKLKRFIPYFDLPFQHISTGILKKMGRYYDENGIIKLLEFISSNFENKFIRTNIIVGFPGETIEDFNKLKDFMNIGYFDNVSLFEYFDESFASSSKLEGKLSDEEIRSRFLQLKKIVNKYVLKNKSGNQKKEGYIMDIKSNGKIIVRNWLNCPEIDPYDQISINNIVEIFGNSDSGKKEISLEIGMKISYVID